MYMTCQPLRPNRPSRARSPVDIGAPTATATGRPTRKPETMVARKPVGEVEDNTRKESSLRDAQQEAHCSKACRACNHSCEARQYSPGDHDPGNPYSRADFFQDQVAWNLENEIAPVKHANCKSESAGRHAEVAAHG